MANISKKIHELIIFNHSRYIPFWAKTECILGQNARQDITKDVPASMVCWQARRCFAK